jgi:Fur family ferric uptake transcriptional regulator
LHVYHARVPIADPMATLLAAAGHRITAPRRAVLRAIADFEGPFTIEELTAATPQVGRATVFRTVKLLQEAEVVCRMVLEDGAIRYELSSGGHHHHLICGECGRVEEFAESALDAFIDGIAARYAFDLLGHSLELYGRCASCRAAARA